jgi:hypothetical protein
MNGDVPRPGGHADYAKPARDDRIAGIAEIKIDFPDVPVWHGDIAELWVDECLRITGLKPGELDVLDGSPPFLSLRIGGIGCRFADAVSASPLPAATDIRSVDRRRLMGRLGRLKPETVARVDRAPWISLGLVTV